MKITVYTQNCFGIPVPGTHLRLKKIAAKISELQPDVVFLQEIQWKRHVSIFDIADYQMFLDDGLYATAGGLLTLVKKEFLGKHRFFKFKAQGGVKQIADRALGKGMLDVVLENNVHLINTHLMSTYTNKFVEDRNQKKQLEQFIDYTFPFKKFVAGGDFNFDEGSAYHMLLQTAALDVTSGLGASFPITKQKIDFIVGKGVKKILKKELVEYEGFVSDHKGIYCRIEL